MKDRVRPFLIQETMGGVKQGEERVWPQLAATVMEICCVGRQYASYPTPATAETRQNGYDVWPATCDVCAPASRVGAKVQCCLPEGRKKTRNWAPWRLGQEPQCSSSKRERWQGKNVEMKHNYRQWVACAPTHSQKWQEQPSSIPWDIFGTFAVDVRGMSSLMRSKAGVVFDAFASAPLLFEQGPFEKLRLTILVVML